MKFECGDLERALAVSDLMPEAREHLKHCAACRREYRIWNDLSSAAKGLHEDWDTPLLWPAIRRTLEQEEKLKPKPRAWSKWKTTPLTWNLRWKLASAIAACLLLLTTGILFWLRLSKPGVSAMPAATSAALLSGDRDFLTEKALREVEKTEAAYRDSIGKLSAIAEPQLRQPASPVAVNCREKLLMLDAAIADTRSNLDHNRFNVRLRMDLADLYREKQQTLKELLTSEKKN